MIDMDIQMTVNGQPAQVSAEPTRTLLSVLRDKLGLTGTKDGLQLGRLRRLRCATGRSARERLHGAGPPGGGFPKS